MKPKLRRATIALILDKYGNVIQVFWRQLPKSGFDQRAHSMQRIVVKYDPGRVVKDTNANHASSRRVRNRSKNTNRISLKA